MILKILSLHRIKKVIKPKKSYWWVYSVVVKCRLKGCGLKANSLDWCYWKMLWTFRRKVLRLFGCDSKRDCWPWALSLSPFSSWLMRWTALFCHVLSPQTQRWADGSWNWILQSCEPKYPFSLLKLWSQVMVMEMGSWITQTVWHRNKAECMDVWPFAKAQKFGSKSVQSQKWSSQPMKRIEWCQQDGTSRTTGPQPPRDNK
jgi:hypothetical protein